MSQATSASTVFSGMLKNALNQLYGTTDPVMLAEKCGITIRKMKGYLDGEFTPSLGTLARMCKGLSDHRLAVLVRAAEEPPEQGVDEAIRQEREDWKRAAEAEERSRQQDEEHRARIARGDPPDYDFF